MIRRALKLRKYLDRVLFEFGREWKEQNTTSRGTLKSGKKLPRMLRDEGKLTDNDWIAFERLEKILQHYETVVKTLEGDGQVRRRRHGYEGSYGNIWDVILGMEKILGMLEKEKREADAFPDPEQFRIGVNLAWEKLEKYYKSK